MSAQLRVARVKRPDPALLATLTALEREAFGGGGLSNAWLLMPMIEHGLVFVLYEGGEAIGIAELMRDWDQPDTAYLYGVTVQRDRRGGGRGRYFMEGIFERLRDAGIRRVRLTVAPDNSPARHLYEERFGFRVTERVTAAFGPGEDRLLMEAPLTVASPVP